MDIENQAAPDSSDIFTEDFFKGLPFIFTLIKALKEYELTPNNIHVWESFIEQADISDSVKAKALDIIKKSLLLHKPEGEQASQTSNILSSNNAEKKAVEPLSATQEEGETAPQSKASYSIAEKAIPNRDALIQYIELGFTLYAQEETQEGRRFVDWRQFRYNTKDNSKITDSQELDAALKAGIILFGFQPKERGFVCLDIDCGHDGGGNGWQNYYALLKNNGIEEYNPLEAAKVIVDTPSGGNHIYFLAREETTYGLLLCDCIEVFGAGTAKTLTAAGSMKKGKVYRLRGNLKDATPLPRKIANLIAKDIFTEQSVKSAGQAKNYSSRRGYSSASLGKYPEYTLAEKVSYYADKSPKAGRNNTAHYCALRLGWQSSFTELYEAMRADSHFAGLPDSELRTAIQSGMANSKRQ